jgi:ribose transport system ATP-binding protein
MRSLSGGNQQKVVLARWFSLGPKVAVLDEPFQGIDIGAKNEIFAIIADAATRGVCVVIVDSDFENLCRISDRVLVVDEGRISEEITADRANQTDEVTRSVLLAHMGSRMEKAS